MLEIKKDFNLKNYNTFGITVFADFFVEIHSISDLLALFKHQIFKSNKHFILGGGSNLLLTKNVNALVIHNKIKGISFEKGDAYNVYIKCGAGEIWHDFVMYCVDNQLAGIENMSLIPGTVGAAPIQNIGAYGVELKDTFWQLEAISLIDGEIKIFNRDECKFGYRESVFKNENKGKYFITSVTFRMNKTPNLNVSYGAISDILKKYNIEKPSIKNISDAVIEIRKSKLPDPAKLGNSGSFFKNPEIENEIATKLKSQFPTLPVYTFTETTSKLAAGWLIEQCGWKGKIVGNTGSHKDQALVLVNYGNATGQEIWDLAIEIQKSVFEKFNVLIQPEVNVV